eukprot:TRINITY_DN7792_c0_g1_i2.p1 TRINITY_DN7792_c0_g1~~TRINITY_DN7792_c0_g1_i2.p1  ORF type:complete len:324 (-),score=38.15 TRINITY_DN7792_c0_g1_i2:222-1193(-)
MELAAQLRSFVIIGILYLVVALLNHFAPGVIVDGYAQDSRGKRLKYKLNGLRIFLFINMFYIGCIFVGFDGSYLIDDLYHHLLSANLIGLVASSYFYVVGDNFPNHVCAPKILHYYKSKPRSTTKFRFSQSLYDFFFGFELNPRFGNFDFKMYLYLIGSIMIELIIISCVYKHYMLFGSVSSSMCLYSFLMTLFLVDYIYHEHVHLYTYDFIDENVGFKLVWGCLCFYGFFYPIGIYNITYNQVSLSNTTICLIIITYVIGSILTRGANLQKYYFKIDPTQPFLGIKPRAIGGKLLVSGWWGLSRHITINCNSYGLWIRLFFC